jgi:predicted site-specific integrase-resolvase
VASRNDHLLIPAEVAALLRVDLKTVTLWARAGKLSPVRTLAGHPRYRASEIRRLFSAGEWAGIVDVTDSKTEIVDIRDQLST